MLEWSRGKEVDGLVVRFRDRLVDVHSASNTPAIGDVASDVS